MNDQFIICLALMPAVADIRSGTDQGIQSVSSWAISLIHCRPTYVQYHALALSIILSSAGISTFNAIITSLDLR